MAGQEQGYFFGVDIGTGSARVCLIDSTGTILSVTTKPIQTWKPEYGHYAGSFEMHTLRG
jgi:ribulose kinase